MGTLAGAEIDTWLRDGGLVVTASDRAARALQSGFHQRRRADGLSAWPSPSILDYASFTRAAWAERAVDGRMLLNPAQEQSLWSAIAGREGHLATLLEGPRHRLAAMAMQAHELLCSYAPRYLRETARAGWDRDAGAFSGWLSAFERTCRESNLLSPGRAPLELISLLQQDAVLRPPLLVAGFDRILSTQQAIFDAWGSWRRLVNGQPASDTHFYKSTDGHAELDACAQWCMRLLVANPDTRVLVITQEISNHRGEIERAFLRFNPLSSAPLFEFSLGIPLRNVPVARALHLLLKWLAAPLEENELDWLFRTGFATASPAESAALQAYVRALRRNGLERTQWTLEAFIRQESHMRHHRAAESLPVSWIQRISAAQRQLADLAATQQSPLDWAALVPRFLAAAGWRGEQGLSSAQHQALHRWDQALDACGSLGFDGRRIAWPGFLTTLTRTLDETLFAPESRNAPIQIAGSTESAGLTADAIWFLGADEDAWPAKGSVHPLLPLPVQREAAMPHSTPRQDWDLAHSVTTRLLASASIVNFSFAAQNKDSETRPSRLITQLAGAPQVLPAELKAPRHPDPIAVSFIDAVQVPFPRDTVEGGSAVLTSLSQCAFKAFATSRLAAKGWNPAEAGLTASQRGQLLHDVLHAIWGGPPRGLRTLAELQACANIKSFVEDHVQTVLHENMPAAARENMPPRYLEIEERRLADLVTEWLAYEATRLPFSVAETEAKRSIDIAGLHLSLRLDRIDQLNDGSLLVIDYKSGNVSPKSWDLPRPDDVQLPLYAGFAIDSEQKLGGLVFAKVRAGQHCFAGSTEDPAGTLFAGLKGTSSLVRARLTLAQLNLWQRYIQQLARDFLAGRATVDPRQYPITCEHCGLQSLCRIQEREQFADDEDEPAEAEAADE
jgi:probable DNA repair protein